MDWAARSGAFLSEAADAEAREWPAMAESPWLVPAKRPVCIDFAKWPATLVSYGHPSTLRGN